MSKIREAQKAAAAAQATVPADVESVKQDMLSATGHVTIEINPILSEEERLVMHIIPVARWEYQEIFYRLVKPILKKVPYLLSTMQGSGVTIADFMPLLETFDFDTIKRVAILLFKGSIVDERPVGDISEVFYGKPIAMYQAILEALKVNFPPFRDAISSALAEMAAKGEPKK